MLELNKIQISKMLYMKSFTNSKHEFWYYFKYEINNIYGLLEIKTKFVMNNQPVISYINFYMQSLYVNHIMTKNKDIKFDIYSYNNINSYDFDKVYTYSNFEKEFFKEYNVYKYPHPLLFDKFKKHCIQEE